jgi:LysM repeat protein
MKSTSLIAIIAALIFVGLSAQTVQANGGEWYTVQQGDTLVSIAARYGLPVDELLRANNLGWDSWISSGQQLVIPNSVALPAQNTGWVSDQPVEPGGYYPAGYVDNPGFERPLDPNGQFGFDRDPFQPYPFSSDQRPQWSPWGEPPGTAYPQNGLGYQEPGFNFTPASAQVLNPEVARSTTPFEQLPVQRWIDVNLTTQTLTAYEGMAPVHRATVSTGRAQYPTIVGTFEIYVKYAKARMRGGRGADAYDLPDVPNVMYFHNDYGLHGTYWHDNFGTPMSHGCVNLSIADSEWIFNWASVGTQVVTHY